MTEFEEWRSVNRCPLYEVSSLGRIRNVRTGLILKGGINSWGYRIVTLCRPPQRESVAVYALVCEAFHGQRPSPTHQVAHNNGVSTNDRASNLRWATPTENQRDRLEHGTHMRGSRNHRTKLSVSDVCAIKAQLATGVMQTSLARQYQVSKNAISAIKHGRTWSWTGESTWTQPPSTP